MVHASLNGRFRMLAGHSLGRVLVAACTLAFLATSIPNLHWHEHGSGHAVHEHSAFDAPDVDHHDHDPPHDPPHDLESQRGPSATGDDTATLHLHDGNHSLSAVGTVPPSPVQTLKGLTLLAGLAAHPPPPSLLIPPYRPPIV
jgi:hypothetical protein